VRGSFRVAVSVVLVVLVAAEARAADAFAPLFSGTDLTGWKVPAGDNGHWKVLNGIIDYDARSEAAGDKALWTERSFGDFVLRAEWRLKETPYTNPHVQIVLPDGNPKRGADGQPIQIAVPDSDSGIYLRGDSKSQVNIWCWPVGSGEVYGYRTDPAMPPDVRAGVTPRTNADHDIGQWNAFEITMVGDRLTVVLNGTKVLDNARLPGVAPRGPIALQHHGEWKDGQWQGPPSLVQFRNIEIRELGAPR